MPTPSPTDRIAVLAARLVCAGRIATVQEAIHVASERLELLDSDAPSHGLVRRHLQAMLMQELGAEGYQSMTRRRLEVAEEVMSTLAAHTDVVDVLLAGRGASGHLDGDLTLHIRVYTRRTITDLAEDLVLVGYEEPRFATAETRFGRLDRLLFRDGDVDVAMTRCLPEQRRSAEQDLFTGRAVPVMSLGRLRGRLDATGDLERE